MTKKSLYSAVGLRLRRTVFICKGILTPILPGVAQMDWVIQLAGQHWSTPTSIQRIEVLKFNDMILPGATVDLLIERKRDDCITFKYSDGDKALSSGRLVFT